jgi:hypothetical protein
MTKTSDNISNLRFVTTIQQCKPKKIQIIAFVGLIIQANAANMSDILKLLQLLYIHSLPFDLEP